MPRSDRASRLGTHRRLLRGPGIACWENCAGGATSKRCRPRRTDRGLSLCRQYHRQESFGYRALQFDLNLRMITGWEEGLGPAPYQSITNGPERGQVPLPNL